MLHEYAVDGYKVEVKNRCSRGGGVAMYIKNNVSYLRRCDLESHDIEIIWLQISLRHTNYLICSVYRPPSANNDYFEKFLDGFDCVSNGNNDCNNVIVTGDLNIHYDKTSVNNPLCLFESLFNLTQIVDEYTRVTNSTKSIIDVVFTSNPQVHETTKIFHVALSDHYLVFTSIKVSKDVHNSQSHKEIKYRSYKKFDEYAFIEDLTNASILRHLENSSNVEMAWDYFKSEFLRICDLHAPICVSRLKNRYKPWVNSDIVKLMYRRDFLYRKAVSKNDPTALVQYKNIRNQVNVLINRSKSNYYEKLYNESKHNSKYFWKELNKLSDKVHSEESISLEGLNASELNEFFVNIGINTTGNLPEVSPPWKNPDCLYHFRFCDINCESVCKLLKQLNTSSSLDVLTFDSKLLRIAYNVIAPLLTFIYNMSLSSGVIPYDWKYSRVSPVYKGKGDASDPSNFRPISVICHIAKIFEKEVQCQLVSYLIKYDFISLDQSAYRTYHSTITSLHNTIDEWLQNIDDKLLTAVCFLDISKCFDTIDHRILLEKMNKYGIKDTELKWFKSYLNNRSQSVFYKNKLSPALSMKLGVPQGSNLGPLLFVLFVNDLPLHVRNSRISMFADDTIIYNCSTDARALVEELNETLVSVNEWYISNRLTLNVSKSNIMFISNLINGDTLDNFSVSIGDVPINQTDVTKYLGVLIDNKLKFDVHINNLVKNLSSKLRWLSGLRHIVPRKVLELVYFTYILPIFDYACSLWGCTNANVAIIQRLQNRAARIITAQFDIINVRGISIVKELGWLTVKDRINYFLGVYMYRCIHGLAPLNLCNAVVMACETHDRNTRLINSNDVAIPFCRTDIMKKSFIYRASVVWNSLPNDIKMSESLEIFKKHVKQYYFRCTM